MKTHLHTPSNLYTYIGKTQNMANLRAQIENKEKELKLTEEAIEQFELNGFKEGVERLTAAYNKLHQEILLLKIDANRLERQLLLFELEISLED
jgi:hypothetical protein